jgi:FHA domain
MSFRLFIYYCAIGGAWAGFIGWVLGARLAPPPEAGYLSRVWLTSLQGMLLGLVVAFGLSFLDATFNVSLRQIGKVIVRVLAAMLVGLFAGLFGSFIGESLFYLAQTIDMPPTIKSLLSGIAFIFGWTIVGFLIGFSICFFEIINGLIARKDFGGAVKKVIKCVIGGTIGGILGGIVAFVLNFLAQQITDKALWTPTALGFIAIGACIGLLVGLAQIILKEAWIKVEAGFRPGREMLLLKEKTSIGRAEGSDIALFGDSGVEKTHAAIILEGGRYYLEDLQTPGGTYVNDQKIDGRAPLKTGDLIRVGKSVLRFNERAKRKD